MALAAGLAGVGCWAWSVSGERVSCYVVHPQQQRLAFYYRDEQGRRFGSIGQLRAWLAQRHEQLLFATNGGMYAPGNRPKGLFVEQGRTVTPLDTASGPGNFYLQPNGVFYLTSRRQPVICATRQFPLGHPVAFATQSGPLLLVGGAINPLFTQGSANVEIRNGVGILPDSSVVFAISSRKINFYDFAAYFQHLGCRHALYLDGYVSRMYLPAQGWQQTGGDFGVIVGVTAAASN